MKDKKKQILETATKLFAEKGYHSTTMQEIAEFIGVAKGSLYNIFKSKEEILLSIFDYYHTDLSEKVFLVRREEGMTSKEKLEKILFIQFHGFEKNKVFIKMQVKEQLNHESEAIQHLMLQFRASVLNWHYQFLLEAYGERIKPFIWDLVHLLNGMIKEYMMLLVYEEKKMNGKEVSTFITDRLDGMIHEMLRNNPDPIIRPEMMKSLQNINSEDGIKNLTELIRDEINKLERSLHSLDLYRGSKQEYLDSLEALKEQIDSNETQTFLVKALMKLLLDEPILKLNAKNLADLIEIKYEIKVIE